MKPEEAIQLLDQTVAQLQVTREVHVRLQQAIDVLKPKQTKKVEKKKE